MAASGAAVGTSILWPWPGRAGSIAEYRLVAHPGRTHLVGAPYPETSVWSYNGKIPGPANRLRQGERLRVLVEDRLDEETTVHWHGLRVPNAMDAMPHLTQRPIAPGEVFVYEFDLPDADTYWYHPHQRSFEQVGRGLYGPLIVEEREPLQVDREATWVLDDWRLEPDAQISSGFGDFMDVSHGGRLGNTVTVNGRILAGFRVRAGERVRLRLINAANARIFGLEFQDHLPTVIALDGQPVEPHESDRGRIVLGPAVRADLVIDMSGAPGGRFAVADTFYRGREYRLLDLVYTDEQPLREHPLDAPVRLAANTMPAPDLRAAEQYEVTFGGGMMGGMIMPMMGGRRVDMREMIRGGMAWAINGVAATGHVMDPLLALRRSRSYVLALSNGTAWHHPIHPTGTRSGSSPGTVSRPSTRNGRTWS